MIFRKTAPKKIERNFEKLEEELENTDWEVLTEDNLGTNIWHSDEIQNHIKKLLINTTKIVLLLNEN